MSAHKNDLLKRAEAKRKQTESRAESNARGTRGRAEQKHKAQSAHKNSGGKMAR